MKSVTECLLSGNIQKYYLKYTLTFRCTIVLVILLIIISTIVLGCSRTSENGDIKVGQEFSVVLETDWKSQTRWTLSEYDKDMVKLISSYGEEDLDPNRMLGKASSIFLLKALKAGETDLVFKLEKIYGTGDYDRATRHIVIK